MINEKILSAEKEVLKDEMESTLTVIESTMKAIAETIERYEEEDLDFKIVWVDTIVQKADWLRDDVAKLKSAKEKLELLKVVGA